MATKQKDSVPGKEKRTGPSPMGGTSTHTERRRLRPSTPPGMKDHGKAPVSATSSTARPNHLKPTVSSKPDAGRHLVKKHEHDDTNHHKPSATTVRRRSFDRPIPPSQVHKAAVHSSSTARGERNTASTLLKSSGTRPVASSERVSKVVKAVKAQPPLVKVKSLPKLSSISKVRKEVKTTGLKRAEEEPVHAPSGTESEAEEQESLDLNVEEELAKMESHVDLPPEKLLAEEDKEHFDENHLSPTKHVDADEEKQVSDDIKISEDHQDEGLVADKNTESGEVANDEKQADESEQESNQPPLNEAPPAEDDDTKKDEKEAYTEEIKPVGLTVKTTPDESGQVVENENRGLHSAGEKPANAEAENVVHKRQVGGPRSKKESPAYNDVIEETASKLVEKRVNKVRALAGAFETVISLQQPDSS